MMLANKIKPFMTPICFFIVTEKEADSITAHRVFIQDSLKSRISLPEFPCLGEILSSSQIDFLTKSTK